MLHIIRNLLARFTRLNHGHKNLIWQLKGADTHEE